jgi:hypothetical protein
VVLHAELIAGDLAHATTPQGDGTDAEYFGADEQLDELVSDEPERAWRLVCEIVRPISPAEKMFPAYLAAGPIEDLLARHPPRFIEPHRRVGGKRREFS